MKISELKLKTLSELQVELIAALEEQFKLRMQKGADPKKTKPSAFKKVRKYIARIKTIMHQKAN